MNDNHGERRHANDALLIEMHGMLSRLMERVEGHVQWDERVHGDSEANFKALEARILPVEEFHGSMKTAGKVGAIIATPALLAIGGGLWEWIRHILFHTKEP